MGSFGTVCDSLMLKKLSIVSANRQICTAVKVIKTYSIRFNGMKKIRWTENFNKIDNNVVNVKRCDPKSSP